MGDTQGKLLYDRWGEDGKERHERPPTPSTKKRNQALPHFFVSTFCARRRVHAWLFSISPTSQQEMDGSPYRVGMHVDHHRGRLLLGVTFSFARWPQVEGYSMEHFSCELPYQSNNLVICCSCNTTLSPNSISTWLDVVGPSFNDILKPKRARSIDVRNPQRVWP